MSARAAGIGRRRFLVAGGASALLVATGVVLTGCGEDEPRATGLADLFGDAAPAVAELGAEALAIGAYADGSAAAAALPPEGIAVDGDQVTLVDQGAFVGAVQAAQAEELAGGELTVVAGYPFTATELAVAVTVHAGNDAA